MISFICDHCDRDVQTSDDVAGLPIRCPNCQSTVVVPRRSTSGVASTPPQPRTWRESSDSRPQTPAKPAPTVQMGGRVLFALFGLLIAPGMIGLSIYAFLPAFDYSASAKWPTVEGTVDSTDMLMLIKKSSRGSSSTEYQPIIRYSYTVNGSKYEGATLRFGDDFSNDDGMSEANAESILAKYKEGTTVQVLYDPADPNHAVLERALNYTTVGIALMALAGLYAGLRMLLIAFTPSRIAEKTTWSILTMRNSIADIVIPVLFGGPGLLMYLGGLGNARRRPVSELAGRRLVVIRC